MHRHELNALREPLLTMEMKPADDDSSAGGLDDVTMEDIKSEKARLVAQRDSMAYGVADVPLPPNIHACISAMRGNCMFRTLVARNPKTKLTELHLLQPLLLLFIVGGLAVLPITGMVLSNLYDPSQEATISIVLVLGVTSVGLSSVGLIARSIPSHEDLNVEMDEQVGGLGVGVEGVEGAATDASELEKKMRLGWLAARRKTRDATRELHSAYVRDVQDGARFEFKVKLLQYLSSGESLRAMKQQRDLEEEFESNYKEMAQLYENPIAELKRKKSMFEPNGRLSRDELATVVDEVGQTENASDGAYEFLGELIEAVLADGFDTHVADSPNQDISYSELVHLLLRRANTPLFRERYMRAFCLDIEGAEGSGPTQQQQQHGHPSPPPSPPMAATTASAVGFFLWVETYKAVLFRKVWFVGLACLICTAVLLALSLGSPRSGAVRRATFATGSLLQLSAAVIGWWTCNNKKDDLNTMRSLEQMRKLVARLALAEGKLRGALDAMLVSGGKMDALDAEIEAAFATAKQQLAQIRDEHHRRREGIKGHTIRNVLMKFVNMDGRMNWYDHRELQKLYGMIRAMTGEPDTPLEQEMHEHLRLLLLPEKLVPGPQYLAEAVPPIIPDQLPGNQVLDILMDHNAFEMIMNLPLEECSGHEHHSHSALRSNSVLEDLAAEHEGGGYTPISTISASTSSSATLRQVVVQPG